AAVLDGTGRADAARIGGMDRQRLRDLVHRVNENVSSRSTLSTLPAASSCLVRCGAKMCWHSSSVYRRA
ncbi:hypothetical protein, partial [Mesorhizobium sp.]|uniref:hypothetical protein n=1 Tax=Mesorhizobium sp. TaxID=1871066 RepID=UPI00257EC5EE